MNRNARLLLILPLLLFVSACIDRDPMDPNVVAGPQLAWVDAVDGFYFFSPIGSGVTGARLIGTQAPTVDVCPKTASVCDEATAIAHFTRTLPGTGNATMQLSPENAYQVDWNTQFTENSHNIALFPAVYVIVVRVGDEVLGTADIAFFTSIGQMKKANPNVFAVLKGRSLPIKFGITLEALIGVELATEDFVIKTFTTDNTVQTAVVPSEQAAFQVNGSNVIMPPGFEGSTEFTVVIYQKELTEAGECEPAYNGPQFGGCYVYETIPQGVTFYDGGGNAVGVGGVCPDLDVPEEARLAKFDEGVTTFPDEGPEIEELDCAEEIIGLHRLPRVLRGLARLALPRPLHAKDLGETGTMGAFSTLFWAPPYELAENPASPLPTDPLTAGAQLSLQFRVMSTHDDPLDPGPKPQSGVTVAFSVPANGGSLSAASDVSDVTGVVNVTWTLPALGNHTLTVSAPDALSEDSVPVTFEYGVTVAPAIIVWNDGNTFDATAMADPDNVTLVKNLVNFTGTGSRAAGTKVLLDRGRTSSTTGLLGAAFESALTGAGSTISTILTINSSTSSPLTVTDPAVKAIFLIGPTEAYTTAEVNTLKQFAADGGRIIFIGEHAGFAPTTGTVQNGLLTALGSGASNIGGAVDCVTVGDPVYRNAGAGQLGAQQITTGVTGFAYACMSALSLGANDIAILSDNNVSADDQGQPTGPACAGNCVLAAAVRISTTPTPILLSIAGRPSAQTGSESTANMDLATLKALSSGMRR